MVTARHHGPPKKQVLDKTSIWAYTGKMRYFHLKTRSVHAPRTSWYYLCIMIGVFGILSTTSCSTGMSPVERHGQLSVKDGVIMDASGRPVQLRGMSTMGLQWYGDIVNDEAFEALARDWKVDVIRLAMYIGEGGYAKRPGLKDLVRKGVELARKHGLYVIIDWHMLSPGNPNDPLYSKVDDFFAEMSADFGSYPNVLYEIMNEPNGQLSWEKDLKPYAERLIGVIRANDPDNLILIGSGRWSQEVDVAASDPPLGTNLAYTFHFYAGSHGEELRDRVRTALAKGEAVFCSEWGMSEASGDNGIFPEESRRWLDFLDEHRISWVNWSLGAKNESSAAFTHGAILKPWLKGPDGSPVWPASTLSPSGTWVREELRRKAD